VLRGARDVGDQDDRARIGEKSWVLAKARDEHARDGSDVVAARPESVRSARTWQEVAERG